tara:strand:+ start:4104 stop:4313 length:210 start_codon:yes stop_codon:yes gene_type:complete
VIEFTTGQYIVIGYVINFIVTFVIMSLLLKGLSIYKDYLKVRENSYDEFLEKKQILQEKMEQKKRESEQ